jgi:5S rRNA maturation endonuclease (ribonuclease M5)
MKDNKYLLFEYLNRNNVRYTVNTEETSIRMSSIDSNNYNGLSLSLNTMVFYDFKTDRKGTIIDLLVETVHKSIYEIYMEIKQLILHTDYEVKISKNINSIYEYEKRELLNYPKQLLNLYPNSISSLFLKDGLNEVTQALFDIRYDKESDRILIPVIFKGNLIGMIGRYNSFEVPKKIPKYFPILVYPKSEILFGYDLCESSIKSNGNVLLVESEKSVMKSIQEGLFNTLAVGGSNISKSQINLLEGLNVKNVFVCFDSDKNKDDMLKFIERKFKNVKFNVYFLDNNTRYIKKKSCIFDMGWEKNKIIKYLNKFNTKVIGG